MSTPQVIVDLDGLNLSEEEVNQIGVAVKNTVLMELGGLKRSPDDKVAVLPVFDRREWIGLVIRDLRSRRLNVPEKLIDEIIGEVAGN